MTGFYEDTIQAAITNEIFGDDGAVPSVPATFYVALFTTTPDTDGTGGVEAAYTDYARFAVANDLTEFSAASGSPPVVSNSNDWDFGVAGSGPTIVLSFGFYDDPTAGNLWAVVALTGAPVTINNGADVKFLAGDVDLGGCA